MLQSDKAEFTPKKIKNKSQWGSRGGKSIYGSLEVKASKKREGDSDSRFKVEHGSTPLQSNK